MDKLRIAFCSDLHIDFWVGTKWNKPKLDWFVSKLTNGVEADVAVIAGDLGHINQQIEYVVKEIAKHFELVIVTYGNHELYVFGGEFENSWNRLDDLSERLNAIENVEFCKGYSTDVIGYRGFNLFATPMWYDFSWLKNRYGLEKEQCEWLWKWHMNDASHIKPKIDVEQTHKWFRDRLEIVLNNWQIDILITHIPPFTVGTDEVSSFYRFDADGLNFDGVKLWICGHDHLRNVRQVGEMVVAKNAIGYPREYDDFGMRVIEIEKD